MGFLELKLLEAFHFAGRAFKDGLVRGGIDMLLFQRLADRIFKGRLGSVRIQHDKIQKSDNNQPEQDRQNPDESAGVRDPGLQCFFSSAFGGAPLAAAAAAG